MFCVSTAGLHDICADQQGGGGFASLQNKPSGSSHELNCCVQSCAIPTSKGIQNYKNLPITIFDYYKPRSPFCCLGTANQDNNQPLLSVFCTTVRVVLTVVVLSWCKQWSPIRVDACPGAATSSTKDLMCHFQVGHLDAKSTSEHRSTSILLNSLTNFILDEKRNEDEQQQQQQH